ncbi:Transcription regulator HTH, APSES-type DNA-binding domain [Phaffia rhodozyma]|uniref:Transcription regulator HTH, APSES-type DNA-binding domain n=1 Tax=Phaffia rhodozyma TaxID=264483 RepID=A0A0F7SS20_PHARH|nr:Transcription regulator HTH, APSES-type DNA-binding domain [Phaffia rhodozyma]
MPAGQIAPDFAPAPVNDASTTIVASPVTSVDHQPTPPQPSSRPKRTRLSTALAQKSTTDLAVTPTPSRTTSSNDSIAHGKGTRRSTVDDTVDSGFPPTKAMRAKLAEEDLNDKVLMAICAAIWSSNNRALGLKELSHVCVSKGWLRSSPAITPEQQITSSIRSHARKAALTSRPCLLSKHLLLGSVAEAVLAPALHPDACADGRRPRGTVWYLSNEAIGCKSPFVREGLESVREELEGTKKRKREEAAVKAKEKGKDRVLTDETDESRDGTPVPVERDGPSSLTANLAASTASTKPGLKIRLKVGGRETSPEPAGAQSRLLGSPSNTNSSAPSGTVNRKRGPARTKSDSPNDSSDDEDPLSLLPSSTRTRRPKKKRASLSPDPQTGYCRPIYLRNSSDTSCSSSSSESSSEGENEAETSEQRIARTLGGLSSFDGIDFYRIPIDGQYRSKPINRHHHHHHLHPPLPPPPTPRELLDAAPFVSVPPVANRDLNVSMEQFSQPTMNPALASVPHSPESATPFVNPPLALHVTQPTALNSRSDVPRTMLLPPTCLSPNPSPGLSLVALPQSGHPLDGTFIPSSPSRFGGFHSVAQSPDESTAGLDVSMAHTKQSEEDFNLSLSLLPFHSRSVPYPHPDFDDQESISVCEVGALTPSFSEKSLLFEYSSPGTETDEYLEIQGAKEKAEAWALQNMSVAVGSQIEQLSTTSVLGLEEVVKLEPLSPGFHSSPEMYCRPPSEGAVWEETRVADALLSMEDDEEDCRRGMEEGEETEEDNEKEFLGPESVGLEELERVWGARRPRSVRFGMLGLEDGTNMESDIGRHDGATQDTTRSGSSGTMDDIKRAKEAFAFALVERVRAATALRMGRPDNDDEDEDDDDDDDNGCEDELAAKRIRKEDKERTGADCMIGVGEEDRQERSRTKRAIKQRRSSLLPTPLPAPVKRERSPLIGGANSTSVASTEPSQLSVSVSDMIELMDVDGEEDDVSVELMYKPEPTEDRTLLSFTSVHLPTSPMPDDDVQLPALEDLSSDLINIHRQSPMSQSSSTLTVTPANTSTPHSPLSTQTTFTDSKPDLSSMAAPDALTGPSVVEQLPKDVARVGPATLVVEPIRQLTPAITATLASGLPVFKCVVADVTLLRRIDSAFINMTSCVETLCPSPQGKQERQPKVDLLKSALEHVEVAFGDDAEPGVDGIWVSLDTARNVAIALMPGNALLDGFLEPRLASKFPAAPLEKILKLSNPALAFGDREMTHSRRPLHLLPISQASRSNYPTGPKPLRTTVPKPNPTSVRPALATSSVKPAHVHAGPSTAPQPKLNRPQTTSSSNTPRPVQANPKPRAPRPSKAVKAVSKTSAPASGASVLSKPSGLGPVTDDSTSVNTDSVVATESGSKANDIKATESLISPMPLASKISSKPTPLPTSTATSKATTLPTVSSGMIPKDTIKPSATNLPVVKAPSKTLVATPAPAGVVKKVGKPNGAVSVEQTNSSLPKRRAAAATATTSRSAVPIPRSSTASALAPATASVVETATPSVPSMIPTPVTAPATQPARPVRRSTRSSTASAR